MEVGANGSRLSRSVSCSLSLAKEVALLKLGQLDPIG